MRRALIYWSVAFAVVIGIFAITVVVVNSTVLSAGGFAGSYLNALARQDASTALELPGVVASEDSAADLLTDSALGDLSEINLVRDTADSDGVHTVTYEYMLNGELTESDFRVRHTGAFLGLFSTWAFDSSPLGTVAVNVLHDDRFRVNGVDLNTDAQPEESGGFLVFVPGVYTFDHESTYLAADDVAVPISEPGSVTSVQVNVQANPTFVTKVDEELHAYLDACATQSVLLPTGCPFGKTFDNRIDSTPEWSISTYPNVEIIPGTTTGEWVMPITTASAHLAVEVRSLFDGTVRDFDEEIPFTVSYLLTIQPDNSLAIQANYG